MSGPFDALRPFYYINWFEDMGEFYVAKLIHRTKGTFRVAYRMKNGSRPRLSPETSESVVDMLLSSARLDARTGGKPTNLKHRMRIYAREIMPSRWKSHRKRMAIRKEQKQMEALPTFGMF